MCAVELSGRRSHAEEVSTFVAAAVLAAHGARVQRGGFAATDVRFFFQLFTNFVEHDVTRPGQDLALTQVRRALDRLAHHRWLRRRGRAQLARGRPGARYVVEDVGLEGLARGLVTESPRRSFEEALFVAMFVTAYGKSVAALAKSKRTARALAKLLDARSVLRAAEAHLARVECDLDARAKAGLAMAEEALRVFAATSDAKKAIARLDRPGSYQLHGVRPLGELLAGLPAEVQSFEIEHGIELRVRALFVPLAKRTRAEREVLRGLLESLE
jgi:hypothetical protein